MIIRGDALTELRKLPAESVHCCVTSPPYWGLRDYGIEGQLGLEKTPEEYVAKLVGVFREVKRVLRPDGTLWLNLGDSYNAGRTGGWPGGKKQWKPEQGKYQGRSGPNVPGLKPKDLVGIPWRVAFALQADGWWLRTDIIWAKPNPMPESVRDRPTRSHEYIFLLSKSARYYFDQEAVKEILKSTDEEYLRAGKSVREHHSFGKVAGHPLGILSFRNVPSGRNIRSVWTMTTKPFPKDCGGEHFATFPPELPERCIKASCPVGGVVLDPFFGAGTVGVVAKQLGRDFIGIELNHQYCEMAERRIAGVAYQMPLAKWESQKAGVVQEFPGLKISEED